MTAVLFVLSMSYMQSELLPDLPNDLAHDWYGVYTWLIIGAVAVVGILAWWDKRSLHRRLTEVEKGLAEVKAELQRERNLLVSALAYIRQLWNWARGDRKSEPPEIPENLRDRLL